jgi:hypothetical protein
MGNNGRGRRSFRNRDNPDTWQRKGGGKPHYDKNRGIIVERPRWTAPRLSQEPLPEPVCPVCGKPIKDLAAALTDKSSGVPVHFDCILSALGEREALEEGDQLAYIGGGRFGIIHYSDPRDRRIFQIKKILQWEEQNTRSDWRKQVTDRYSTT